MITRAPSCERAEDRPGAQLQVGGENRLTQLARERPSRRCRAASRRPQEVEDPQQVAAAHGRDGHVRASACDERVGDAFDAAIGIAPAGGGDDAKVRLEEQRLAQAAEARPGKLAANSGSSGGSSVSDGTAFGRA